MHADAATPATEQGACKVEADLLAREMAAGTVGGGLQVLVALEQRLQAVQAMLIHHMAARGRMRKSSTK